MKRTIKFFTLVSLGLSLPLEGMAQDWLPLYKDLHRNPELSFQEKQTGQRIANELRALGVEVTHPIGGEGVVGVFRNGKGPTLLLRADLDALPVQEKTGVDYASTQPGKMHACGHDIHMTVLVGTAAKLIAEKQQWSGTLVFVGQPAEEMGGGALALLKDGLFERFPRPDYNLALHVSADLPAGSAGFVSGYAMANVDTVDVTFYGIGGHGAAPDKTIDPIVMSAQFITNIQTIVSRKLAALTPAVVTVGSIKAGTQHNIIPDTAHMELTVRSYADESRQKILDNLQRIANGIAIANGVAEDRMPKMNVLETYTPSVYNDPNLTAQIKQHFSEQLGKERIFDLKPAMVGEDFSRYGRVEPRIPSLMYRLGTVSPEKYKAYQAGEISLPTLHSPHFLPDAEKTISTGIQTLSSAAFLLLKKP
ncbi:MAG: amidohydrolase [Pseudomonadota bacterium]